MPEYMLDRSLAREVWEGLSLLERGYIEAAMWTLTGEDGEPLDYLGLHDIAPETLSKAREDCAAFLAEPDVRTMIEVSGHRDEQIGHDLWLTRNGHGAGFWDGDYPEGIGERLTDIAHGMGSVDWYLGDDGNVYQY